MNLTSLQTRALSEVIATLASRAPANDVRSSLAEPMARLMKADFYVSCVWDEHAERFFTPVALNMDPTHVKAWDAYYQFRDTVTPRMKAVGRAAPVDAVIPQRELVRSEFFNDFLSLDGLYWGINMYAFHDGACVGDMRIWRTRSRESFSLQDAELLNMIAPAFIRAMSADPAQNAQISSFEKNERLADAHARVKRAFGLSDRESDVVLLAAQGESDKEIARRLGIGFTTVRYHLHRAFAKTGISGRSRLAHKLRPFLNCWQD